MKKKFAVIILVLSVLLSLVACGPTGGEGGYITNVIAPAETRAQVITALDMLSGKRVSKLPKKHNTL